MLQWCNSEMRCTNVCMLLKDLFCLQDLMTPTSSGLLSSDKTGKCLNSHTSTLTWELRSEHRNSRLSHLFVCNLSTHAHTHKQAQAHTHTSTDTGSYWRSNTKDKNEIQVFLCQKDILPAFQGGKTDWAQTWGKAERWTEKRVKVVRAYWPQ